MLGGARSGKSARALALAAHGSPRTFVATAEALDGEMARRIERHRRERDDGWTVIEEPLELVDALGALGALGAHGAHGAHGAPGGVALVDCLTLWLSNLVHAGRDVEAETARLTGAVAGATARGTGLVLVSNEVGLGLVPETPLGREFRDAQGRLNRAVADACDRVELVVAGQPLAIKG